MPDFNSSDNQREIPVLDDIISTPVELENEKKEPALVMDNIDAIDGDENGETAHKEPGTAQHPLYQDISFEMPVITNELDENEDTSILDKPTIDTVSTHDTPPLEIQQDFDEQCSFDAASDATAGITTDASLIENETQLISEPQTNESALIDYPTESDPHSIDLARMDDEPDMDDMLTVEDNHATKTRLMDTFDESDKNIEHEAPDEQILPELDVIEIDINALTDQVVQRVLPGLEQQLRVEIRVAIEEQLQRLTSDD